MIDASMPTEHLEAAAEELNAVHREHLKNLMAIAGPFAMAAVALAAVRKQRREVRAELARRQAIDVETEPMYPDWHSDELAEALDAIKAVLPESVFITVDSDGHVRLVKAGGEEVCWLVDPVGLANDPGRLHELVNALRLDGD